MKRKTITEIAGLAAPIAKAAEQIEQIERNANEANLMKDGALGPEAILGKSALNNNWANGWGNSWTKG
jgi:hypothetical protein